VGEVAVGVGAVAVVAGGTLSGMSASPTALIAA
jgi:hypothetical protein